MQIDLFSDRRHAILSFECRPSPVFLALCLSNYLAYSVVVSLLSSNPEDNQLPASMALIKLLEIAS